MIQTAVYAQVSRGRNSAMRDTVHRVRFINDAVTAMLVLTEAGGNGNGGGGLPGKVFVYDVEDYGVGVEAGEEEYRKEGGLSGKHGETRVDARN